MRVDLYNENRFFRAGFDAREAGKPISANPYKGRAQRLNWGRGWKDADRESNRNTDKGETR